MRQDTEILPHILAKQLIQQRNVPAGGGGGGTVQKTSPSEQATTSGVERKNRGAQPGNRQALKTGRYTAETCALRAYISHFIKQAEAITTIVDKRLEAKWGKERKAR